MMITTELEQRLEGLIFDYNCFVEVFNISNKEENFTSIEDILEALEDLEDAVKDEIMVMENLDIMYPEDRNDLKELEKLKEEVSELLADYTSVYDEMLAEA